MELFRTALAYKTKYFRQISLAHNTCPRYADVHKGSAHLAAIPCKADMVAAQAEQHELQYGLLADANTSGTMGSD